MYAFRKSILGLIFFCSIGLMTTSYADDNDDTDNGIDSGQVSDTSSQEPMPSWWFNLGAGIGKGENIEGLSGELSWNAMVKEHQFLTVRSVTVSNQTSAWGSITRCLITGNSSCHLKDSFVGDVSALYGLKEGSDLGYASASLGLGYVKGKYTSGRKFDSVGIPGEVQLFWRANDFLGFGVIGFGDANFERSFGGGLIAIQLGDLRN